MFRKFLIPAAELSSKADQRMHFIRMILLLQVPLQMLRLIPRLPPMLLILTHRIPQTPLHRIPLIPFHRIPLQQTVKTAHLQLRKKALFPLPAEAVLLPIILIPAWTMY